jgi:hypothetical protein
MDVTFVGVDLAACLYYEGRCREITGPDGTIVIPR